MDRNARLGKGCEVTLVVQKFGGTSVATPRHILSVADTLIKTLERGEKVVAVVSAMAGVTNQLVAWCRDLGGIPSNPEYDGVISTGECVTAGLLALALQSRGVPSRSWTASQLPLRTCTQHGHARIEDIEVEGLKAFADRGGISVVTGFQGISPDGRLTTLGRGGSDTTAVALAAFLKATRCDIFTDVEGVFTADPRLVENAQKITHLSYEEMLNLSRDGAKVLHPHSVDLAKRHHIPLRVLSSFSFAPGTLISVEGGTYLFGLTYTTGWHLAHGSHPFPADCGYGGEAVCVTPDGITYKAVFPPCHVYAPEHFPGSGEGQEQGAVFPAFTPEKLAAISILTGTCSAENLSSLHRRFLRTLGSAHMPYVELCATEARKWQLWVREDDLPSALRFLHNRLQESEDYDHHDVH